MIYFDNAATSGKKPQTVVNAVSNALVNFSANPGRSGHRLSVKTADAVYTVRQKLAEFFGASGAENVVFTQNCTHAINCVLKGTLRKGEHIIVSSLEHNAVMRPIRKAGFSCSVAYVSQDDRETISNFASLIKPNTRMIFVTGASNVTGQILPIKELAKLCKSKGILFAVDAAQLAGIIPIDMNEIGIDYLCIAPHKSLFAPMGIGVLIAQKPLNDTIIEGGTGSDSKNPLQPKIMPEGFESGTINVPAIMGLSAGVDFVKKIGLEKIYRHEFDLLNLLYSGLQKNENIKLYSKPPVFYKTAPVLSFNYVGVDASRLGGVLDEFGFAVRSGLHCAPSAHKQIGTLKNGTVRVSFGAFNSKDEVQKLLSTLSNNKFIEKLQKTID